MALEQFKTQVLLLHSEQRTLDALGAGFNDRYSVHFATTGSEALTTLGETPIHIIVSAQNLPGMSGLEALREAKKRSPETIGILLAGDSTDDGLEALVGDKEVFQIVRGAIQPEALLKIVENATRRMRMLTLSRSANDTAADVDVPSIESEGEHIVMETAENGTTIISDGTGRMPALKPEKIEASPEAGGRAVDVLVLTKDSDFLDTIRESARGLHNVHHATTAQQAQDAVRNNNVGVLVTDAAIAGSKVELLTRKLREDQPRLVAIVAGRRDDGEMLMEMINRGQVYRFLLKPVSPGRARLAVEASVKHHLEAADTAFKGKPAMTAAPVDTAPAAKSPAAAPAKAATAKAAAPAPEVADVVDPLSQTGSMKASVRDLAATLGKQKSAARKRGGLPVSPALVGAAIAAVAVLAGGIWYLSAGSEDVAVPTVSDAEPVEDDEALGSVTESDIPQPATAQPVAVPDPAYVALLDNARFARDSGRVLAPAGDNAIEWYVQARDAAPQNSVIADELAALVEQVIGIAETALLENRPDAAAQALAMVALASPANPRLTFLNAQVAQLQLRTLLDDARAAIRESRYEDAGRSLTRAQRVPGADLAVITQLTEDLAAARSAERIEDVLAQANERIASGKLTAPSNDNARYFFELALSNDPGNTAAQQGLLVVASKLVLNARAAIDNGNLDAARANLEDARVLDPRSAELAASEAALQAAVERQAEAERRAAMARLAAQQEAEARRLAEERRRAAASATLSTGGQADDNVAAADFAPASTAAASPAAPAAGAAAEQTFVQNEPEPVEQASPPAREPQIARPIAVSELTRINYVAPKYPRNARRRNVSGWVDVAFTVTSSGSVADLEVLDSTPGTIFDDAATEAVSEWRFEPVIENGRPVPRRVAVRMSFSLE